MQTTQVSDLPVSVQFNFETGEFSPFISYEQRCLSQLGVMYYDQPAVKHQLQAGDKLIYDIRYYPFVTSNSDMALGVTRIFPGKVGDEFHMTKGHFHQRDDQPEIYFCVQGEGYLLMETADGDFQAARWQSGTITHIPPRYAHRVVNTGAVPLIFVASYHLSAGHSYDKVQEHGFAQVVVERDGLAVCIPNPRRGSRY